MKVKHLFILAFLTVAPIFATAQLKSASLKVAEGLTHDGKRGRLLGVGTLYIHCLNA